jgi:hypothetical protein
VARVLTTRHAPVSTFRSPAPACGVCSEPDGDAEDEDEDEDEDDDDESAVCRDEWSFAIGPSPVTCGDEPSAMWAESTAREKCESHTNESVSDQYGDSMK